MRTADGQRRRAAPRLAGLAAIAAASLAAVAAAFAQTNQEAERATVSREADIARAIGAAKVVERVDVQAVQEAVRTGPALELSQRTQLNQQAYERFAVAFEADRARQPPVLAEAPALDGAGRPLSRIDWEAVRQDWESQLQVAEAYDAGDMSSARINRPRPVAPLIRNMAEDALTQVRLPVLAPGFAGARTLREDHSATQDGMLMFNRGDAYSASLFMDRVMIEVAGSRIGAVRERDPQAARLMRQMRDSDGMFITQTRFGQEVMFNRYGATYSVLIVCENPGEDPACTDPETARAVARNLMIVGGAPSPEDAR